MRAATTPVHPAGLVMNTIETGPDDQNAPFSSHIWFQFQRQEEEVAAAAADAPEVDAVVAVTAVRQTTLLRGI